MRWALLALWAAWLVNAAALFINQVLHHGIGVGPGPAMGALSLLIQAVANVAIGRGLMAARWIAVAFALISLVPLPMLGRLVPAHEYWAAAFLTLSCLGKVIGTILLFACARPA